MADHSPDTNSTFTMDPLKQEVDKAVTIAAEMKLRPRRPEKELPNIEEVDSKYKNIILKLPVESTMRLYKGFWVPEKFLHGILRMQERFTKLHENDVIVASFPKSGTTWLKALVFSILHRDKYTFYNHPLLKLNSHDCVPFLEFAYGLQDEQHLETLPFPRVLATHAPYSMLPENIKTLNCRIIYICREPKDVLVSFWHMLKHLDWLVEPLPFAQTFENFCMGRVPYGPIWDHVLEYHTKSLHDPEKILFLKYEEMMKNPTNIVLKLANFIGSPFSVEEMKKGVVQEIITLCSFDKIKNLDINKNNAINNDYFFRKAVVGDWQNHMTVEMATKLDEIIQEKLGGCRFTY